MIAANESANDDQFFTSPDGLLALAVVCTPEGETLIGFHGFEWYLQANSLTESSGLQEHLAIEKFVNDVLENRSLIAVLIVDGDIVDVWVTELPESDRSYCRDGETLLFRYWSGEIVEEIGN